MRGLPTVRFRTGLQAVPDEDRKLLDYSELMTSIDEGRGQKFTAILDRYLNGNCENTTREVDQSMLERFPRGSSERFVSKHSNLPLPLNDSQRKILTAVENPKNEIMVVDGPPGTGKSYTITALVYHAAERGKSVVVTSHKQQALDVIDDALTEQFQKLHPQAKPSVLRLNKGKQGAGVNNLRNTLSQQAVNAAHRRSSEINAEAVDSDRERLLRQVDETYMAFLKSAEREESTRMQLLEWAKALDELYDGQEGFAEPRLDFLLIHP